MKVIITESQLKIIMNESYDDYKMSAPRGKSISKISSKLNDTAKGFGIGKSWTDNPKYNTKTEKEIQKINKEKKSDKTPVFIGLGSSPIKDKKEIEKENEEFEKWRIKNQQSMVLSLFSLIGEVSAKIKIKDLIKKRELDPNIVKYVLDKIDNNKSLVLGFYDSYEKDMVEEKIDSYIRKGILDEDIVKYIISKLPKSKL